MKKGLLVVTHGRAGIEMIKTCEMIMGHQENIEALSFLVNDSLDSLSNKFQAALDCLKECEEILCLVDLQGGSPFNVALTLQDRFKDIIFGVNIPLLLDLSMRLGDDSSFADISSSLANPSSYLGSVSQLTILEEDEEF